MNSNASAAQQLGAADLPAPSLEYQMCPGRCGTPIRYGTDALGFLVEAPCDACARRDGKPPIPFRRPVTELGEQLQQAQRDLGEVLLFFTTTWSTGTSRAQRKRLARRVDELLRRTTLPALESPAHAGRTHRAASARAAGTMRACVTCGATVPLTGGRPSKWCDAHRPAHRQAVNARRAIERAGSGAATEGAE
jgi:hypothetical protein